MNPATPAPAEAPPSFHEPSLRQALREAGPVSSNFTGRLNKLSADIKALEAYLDRSGFRIPVEVPFEDPQGRGGSRWTDERPRPVRGAHLAWMKGEPDRWRVIYFHRSIAEEGYPEDTEAVALIETPVEIRVRARPVLAKLLRAVSQTALLGEDPSSPTSARLDDDGMPITVDDSPEGEDDGPEDSDDPSRW